MSLNELLKSGAVCEYLSYCTKCGKQDATLGETQYYLVNKSIHNGPLCGSCAIKLAK